MMTTEDLQGAIRKLQEGLATAFPKAQGDEVTKLRERVLALQAELAQEAPPAGGHVAPVGTLRVYSQLREILLLYKALVVPLLADLEKQRLETVAHMAKAWGPR